MFFLRIETQSDSAVRTSILTDPFLVGPFVSDPERAEFLQSFWEKLVEQNQVLSFTNPDRFAEFGRISAKVSTFSAEKVSDAVAPRLEEVIDHIIGPYIQVLA